MRILITVPWGEPLGGAEAMLQAVLAGAREEGHEPELAFFQSGSWPASLKQAGFRVEVLEAGRLREVHRWVATVARLAGIMRSRRPDLMLNWAAKTHLYGAPAAVITGMGDRVVWWQQAIPRRSWLDGGATMLPAAAIGCYSGASARAQARLFPRRPTFVVAAGAPVPANGSVPSGLRPVPPRELPAGLELPTGVPIVGLVGRLQPWKGQDRLLRAQALLRERGHEMHLLIVGGDSYGRSPEYARSLPVLIEELGLTGAVTLTGEVPDAGPYIEQLDILVNASDPEPFGIVLLEGMSRGVAVVAVDSGGPAEFIDDGRTGLLARSGEPDALADALQPLFVSPERRTVLGQAGLESFMCDYTDAAMRKRFFAGLQEVVERRDRRSHGRLARP
jgi:glycosyltransferase involved in cell wall biosynthesis